MKSLDLEQCPCSGKNINTLVAPWLLMTLHVRDGSYGYEIGRIVLNQLQSLGFGLNVGGVYRHLNSLEKRGVLISSWDTKSPGPAKRRYYLTDAGRECLWRWIGTLSIQATLIGKFLDETQRVFPNALLPKVTLTRENYEHHEKFI